VVDLGMTLSIPRDTAMVPMTRKIMEAALVGWGVGAEARNDISIALSEACANAVQHARTPADYQVDAALRADRCIVEVIDFGVGFTSLIEPGRRVIARPDAEHGRGLHLIHALMDHIEIFYTAGRGVTVHFEKILRRTSSSFVKVPAVGWAE
jgi:serine/threonine-protein kinase RsbW